MISSSLSLVPIYASLMETLTPLVSAELGFVGGLGSPRVDARHTRGGKHRAACIPCTRSLGIRNLPLRSPHPTNRNPKCQPVPVQVRQDARAVRAPPLNRHPLRRRAQACFIDVAVGLRADATRATHRRRPRRRRRRPCRRRPCRRRPRYPFRPCRPLAALATGGVARRRALKSGLCLRRCCTA